MGRRSWTGRLRRKLRNARVLHRRSGSKAVFGYLLHSVLIRVVDHDRLDVIVLRRSTPKVREPRCDVEISCRPAQAEDLRRMHDSGQWGIDEAKLRWPALGYMCLLSEVDGRIGGYTWAHTLPTAVLMDGLAITVPDDLIYNFDGFTHPDFRGFGLQAARHHAVLDQPGWKEKTGLLGYVVGTNYASRRGQGKSGYVRVGTIWTAQFGKRRYAHFSHRLLAVGVGRAR
jgi:hypothetical protein